MSFRRLGLQNQCPYNNPNCLLQISPKWIRTGTWTTISPPTIYVRTHPEFTLVPFLDVTRPRRKPPIRLYTVVHESELSPHSLVQVPLSGLSSHKFLTHTRPPHVFRLKPDWDGTETGDLNHQGDNNGSEGVNIVGRTYTTRDGGRNRWSGPLPM